MFVGTEMAMFRFESANMADSGSGSRSIEVLYHQNGPKVPNIRDIVTIDVRATAIVAGTQFCSQRRKAHSI
jgi:hypothetical protein